MYCTHQFYLTIIQSFILRFYDTPSICFFRIQSAHGTEVYILITIGSVTLCECAPTPRSQRTIPGRSVGRLLTSVVGVTVSPQPWTLTVIRNGRKHSLPYPSCNLPDSPPLHRHHHQPLPPSISSSRHSMLQCTLIKNMHFSGHQNKYIFCFKNNSVLIFSYK